MIAIEAMIVTLLIGGFIFITFFTQKIVVGVALLMLIAIVISIMIVQDEREREKNDYHRIHRANTKRRENQRADHKRHL